MELSRISSIFRQFSNSTADNPLIVQGTDPTHFLICGLTDKGPHCQSNIGTIYTFPPFSDNQIITLSHSDNRPHSQILTETDSNIDREKQDQTQDRQREHNQPTQASTEKGQLKH